MKTHAYILKQRCYSCPFTPHAVKARQQCSHAQNRSNGTCSLQPTNLSMQKTALACSCRRDSRSVTPGALLIHQQAQCQAYPAGGFLAWRRDLHDLWLVKWMTPACFPVSDGMRGLTRGFYTDPFIGPFTLGGERKCQTARRASRRSSVSAIATRSGHVCNCHALCTCLQQCVV